MLVDALAGTGSSSAKLTPPRQLDTLRFLSKRKTGTLISVSYRMRTDQEKSRNVADLYQAQIRIRNGIQQTIQVATLAPMIEL